MPKKKVFISFSAPTVSDIPIIDHSIAPSFLLVRSSRAIHFHSIMVSFVLMHFFDSS